MPFFTQHDLQRLIPLLSRKKDEIENPTSTLNADLFLISLRENDDEEEENATDTDLDSIYSEKSTSTILTELNSDIVSDGISEVGEQTYTAKDLGALLK